MSGTAPTGDYTPIDGYAIVGNCRTAALISARGSVDWLCLPRFDSPSIFGALLDARRGGSFQVCPEGEFDARRRYVPDTNILETTFRSSTGTLRLLDLMPVTDEESRHRHLSPDHELLRVLECVEGEVDVVARCVPRPGYGKRPARLRREGALGIFYEHGAGVLALQGDLPLEISPDGSQVTACGRLRAGERRWLALSHSEQVPAILAPPGGAVDDRLKRTRDWWRAWIGNCHYDGPWRDAVRRSALALKLLTYAPSGAVIAAPTTSLPEKVGGVRNWDYRYCWLRDASLTVRAMLALGYGEEAGSFLAWLLHATRLTWPELQVLYDVYGNARVPEREIPWLEGWKASRPVRVGNAAHAQLQLDVYGEVVDAALRFAMAGGTLDRRTKRTLGGFGKTVCRKWAEPDQGIWEERAEPRHHTFSKVMCWVALDRLVQLYERGHTGGPVDQWKRERERIRAAVEEKGFDEELDSYTTAFGAREVDASLLQLANFEYVDAASPRMRGTLECIRQQLGAGGPLLYRNRSDDGLPPGEGAFGICAFWAAEARARAGDVDGASDDVDALLGYANELGLFPEEMDPRTGTALGNFPQAFTHVGLINAAVTIAQLRGEHATPPVSASAREGRRNV